MIISLNYSQIYQLSTISHAFAQKHLTNEHFGELMSHKYGSLLSFRDRYYEFGDEI